MIEKPLAKSYEEAKKIYEFSKKNNLLLMVGHVEHFNPAFLELKRILKSNDVDIYSIDARRLSYARPNLDKSVDVISDLMIHDIELIVSIIGTETTKLFAQHSMGKDSWGHVSAIWTSKSGVAVNLIASRITQGKVRNMSVNSSLGFFFLDFVKQELIFK